MLDKSGFCIEITLNYLLVLQFYKLLTTKFLIYVDAI